MNVFSLCQMSRNKAGIVVAATLKRAGMGEGMKKKNIKQNLEQKFHLVGS